MRIHRQRPGSRVAVLLGCVAAIASVWLGFAGSARAESKLLAETVEFTGALLFLDMHVPGLVIGVVRDGETAVAGFGEIADSSGRKPDGDSGQRLGAKNLPGPDAR